MSKKKRNELLDSVTGFFEKQPRGRVLELGCGEGDYAKRLKDAGFDVLASDIDKSRFKYDGEIEFTHCDITKTLPFPDKSFDYVLLLEVVEHLRNPYSVFPELNRVLKDGGSLVISTPNILSLKSRFRYLCEGSYEYFREAPLDQAENPKEIIFQLHIAPYRYHELEYLLSATGYTVKDIFTSRYEGHWLSFLLPIIKFQARQKDRRVLRNGGMDYRRINKVLLSKEILFGRHLILHAKKETANALSPRAGRESQSPVLQM